jgi:hypothetical protein
MLTILATLAALPWLQGFSPTAATDHGKRRVVAELAEWLPADDRCTADAYGGLELEAGGQRVLASFAQGLVVLDQDRHAVARAPAFTCQGSADELVALAAGDAWIGTPVLAVAATSGGRNESTTWLTLYRAGDLAPLWTGEVEHHEGSVTTTGVVLLYPGGLVYRSPDGTTQMWRFEPDQRRFINRGEFNPSV